MSTWKLVEAEPLDQNKTNVAKEQEQSHKHNNKSNPRHSPEGRHGNNSRDRNSNGRGSGRRSPRSDIFIPNTVETRQQNARYVVQLMEYYFSDDYLVSTTFIRSYMDEAGYIPIAFILNFPDVMAVGAAYEDILEFLQQSPMFELDLENETIRRQDWQRWLMPNGEGGFGVPRYVKQQQPLQVAVHEQSASPETTSTYGNKNTIELSPDAAVFNPSPK